MGSNPSYLWSIRESQSLINRGVSWKVGDGQNIRAKLDNWIPYDTSHLVVDYVDIVSNSTKVSEFISYDQKTWDIEKVRVCFPPHECSIILALPLSLRFLADWLAWHHSRDGNYTTKLGYKLLSSTSRTDVSTSGNIIPECKKFWCLNIPRKIFLFIWRVLHGCLPTQATLNRRNIAINACYPMCNADLEMDCHILCECSFAKAVWLACKWGFCDNDHQFSSLKEWFLLRLQKLDRIIVEELCCVMWAIWKGHNSLVFKMESMNQLQVIQLGLDMYF